MIQLAHHVKRRQAVFWQNHRRQRVRQLFLQGRAFYSNQSLASGPAARDYNLEQRNLKCNIPEKWHAALLEPIRLWTSLTCKVVSCSINLTDFISPFGLHMEVTVQKSYFGLRPVLLPFHLTRIAPQSSRTMVRALLGGESALTQWLLSVILQSKWRC